jgi:hypothetical protein
LTDLPTELLQPAISTCIALPTHCVTMIPRSIAAVLMSRETEYLRMFTVKYSLMYLVLYKRVDIARQRRDKYLLSYGHETIGRMFIAR